MPVLLQPSGEVVAGDVFYFDYGVVVVWGLSPEEERALVKGLVGPALADPLDASEVEIDGFFFHYTMSEKPHIQNDTFTSECRRMHWFVFWVNACLHSWCMMAVA